MSAQQLFSKLEQSGVLGEQGLTYFELQGVKTIVRDKSIVGNVIQEWLRGFMEKNSVGYRLKKNSQEFPDFLMDSTSDTSDLLEIKCFTKSPNFDVANFQAYARSLLTHAYRLDADYLVFEYGSLGEGITIKRVWLKKIWEICGSSERSPLKIQWKQGIPVNIRPAVWYSVNSKFPPFLSRSEFVGSIKKVLDTSSVSAGLQRNWFESVKRLYEQQTGGVL